MTLYRYGDCMNLLNLFATCQRAACRQETVLSRRRMRKGTVERKVRVEEDVCGKQGRRKPMQGAGGKEHQRKSEGLPPLRKRGGLASGLVLIWRTLCGC